MWALDLGTTNTLLARWDSAADRPVLVDLPAICRAPGGTGELEAARAVPSAVHVLDEPGFWARMGRGRLGRYVLWGKLAHVGRQDEAFMRGVEERHALVARHVGGH